jgi:ribosomal protein L34
VRRPAEEGTRGSAAHPALEPWQHSHGWRSGRHRCADHLGRLVLRARRLPPRHQATGSTCSPRTRPEIRNGTSWTSGNVRLLAGLVDHGQSVAALDAASAEWLRRLGRPTLGDAGGATHEEGLRLRGEMRSRGPLAESGNLRMTSVSGWEMLGDASSPAAGTIGSVCEGALLRPGPGPRSSADAAGI